MPPGHDRLRHGRVLGGISPAPCGTWCAPSRAGNASSSRARAGTCCRGSPSRTPRRRRAGWGRATRPRGARGGRRPVQPGGRGRSRGRRLGNADHALPPPLRGGRRGAGARRRERDGFDPAAAASPRSRRSSASVVSTTARSKRRASPVTSRVKIAYYQASWARRIESQLRDGTAPTEVRGPVHAVRIGDGVIVTGPGETFTEYGIAVKERSRGAPTLYSGYTNEILGYLPTANEYQYGGYEAGYGYKSVGLPSLFDPSVEQIFVETGVRLAERLFPEAEPWDAAAGWLATRPGAEAVLGPRSSTRPRSSPRRCREPGEDRRDRGRLLGLVPVPPVLPRPRRGRARRRGPARTHRARRLPPRVRARGVHELGPRAARGRRRRRGRLLAAQPASRARGRRARGLWTCSSKSR